jgi:hypothetical protein
MEAMPTIRRPPAGKPGTNGEVGWSSICWVWEFFAKAGAVTTARAVKPPKIKDAIRIGILLLEGFGNLNKKDCDDFWSGSSRRRRMFNVRKIFART